MRPYGLRPMARREPSHKEVRVDPPSRALPLEEGP